MERVTRIELALSAWEADVLPLNYTRGLPAGTGNAKDHTRSPRRFARGVIGQFYTKARQGLGMLVIFWQIRTRCRGQHSTQREDAVLAGTGQDGCGATEKKG